MTKEDWSIAFKLTGLFACALVLLVALGVPVLLAVVLAGLLIVQVAWVM